MSKSNRSRIDPDESQADADANSGGVKQVWLFVCLSGIFLVYPHLSLAGIDQVMLNIFFSGSILLSLLMKNSLSRLVRLAYLAIGSAAIVSTWLALAGLSVDLAMSVLYSLFFGSSVLLHFHRLLTEKEVDADTLLGAASSYILLGLFFAAVFAVVVIADPDAFSLQQSDANPVYRLIYFSFTTLTTVGYGDITPRSEVAQMLAVYESIIGQLYLAGVVGVLVGTLVSNKQSKNSGH
ncbi:voltage-gated potassium channel [Rubripirellula lacrimiformis]|uniref:Voltage-gated potassium channel n=1 Tax=Rubripirellula lacrimiformis TaxID=1930273 RepID=A0A517NA29_9BACT|nr:potassium channel family protein [Rubripirellula lacrimiformis]QDT03999.1 voltage-gated potassium channel [Rubripirellula lacrimiformis]